METSPYFQLHAHQSAGLEPANTLPCNVWHHVGHKALEGWPYSGPDPWTRHTCMLLHPPPLHRVTRNPESRKRQMCICSNRQQMDWAKHRLDRCAAYKTHLTDTAVTHTSHVVDCTTCFGRTVYIQLTALANALALCHCWQHKQSPCIAFQRQHTNRRTSSS